MTDPRSDLHFSKAQTFGMQGHSHLEAEGGMTELMQLKHDRLCHKPAE
ncbi:hypothetical protein SynPROS91_02521 [Synechococcus sp. PROS-9-1]|nr:hypothetical protein SynPROS91_02521 [Synechococcus sp. PROS-9-1]